MALKPYSHLAPAERPDAGPEAEEELGHLHAGPAGGEVVAELVHEEHEDEAEDDGDGPPAPLDAHEGGDGQEHGQAHPAALGDLLGGGLGSAAPARVGRRPGPWTLLDVGHRVALLTVSLGRGAGAAIGIDHGVDAVGHRTIMPGKDVIEDVGDRDPPDGAVEEGLHRHLVGGVQPGRGRPAHPTGLVGQAEAAEGGHVGRLEVEPAQRRPSRCCPNGVATRSG